MHRDVRAQQRYPLMSSCGELKAEEVPLIGAEVHPIAAVEIELNTRAHEDETETPPTTDILSVVYADLCREGTWDIHPLEWMLDQSDQVEG